MRRSSTFVRAILSVLVVLGLGTSPVMAASPLRPGDVLVADQEAGVVRHYSAGGVDLGVFVGGLKSPAWITVDQRGNVYVSEYEAERVDKFSPFGENLLTITTAFTPGGVAIGSDGSIYVAHYASGKIHRYSASGEDFGVFASYECGSRCGTDFIKFGAGGNLYVGDFQPTFVFNDGGLIRVFSPLGKDLGNFLSRMGFGWPEGIAFGADGNLYVGSFSTFSIKKFSPTADDLGPFASLGGVGSAYGLAFDRDGNLYAVNLDAKNIHKFSSSGVDLGVFASTGLVGPRDLVIVPLGGPTTENECRKGGWKSFEFPRAFKNQADCIQFVNTGR